MNNKKMYEKIKNHGEEIIKFFSLPQDTDPIKLCKDLFTIENRLHWSFEYECNFGCNSTTKETQDKYLKRIENVCKKYGIDYNKMWINHDPRGHSLKILEQYSADFYYKDWGGCGILAPDFREV